MSDQLAALLELGRALKRACYAFVTVTPETHRRVNAHGDLRARDLRGIFGWNRPFESTALSPALLDLMRAANALDESQGLYRSRVRFSSLRDLLCVHSSYPTDATDAVFFGPDTYRFCALLRRWAPAARRVIDIGCGSGAGGLSLATRDARIVLADVNPRALEFARVNAALNERRADVVHSDVLAHIDGEFDLVIANPPYMRDPAARTYRDGGGTWGEALSVRIVREALARLRPGGTLIVYTGSAISSGLDTFHERVRPLLDSHVMEIEYDELDPDVFGEELDAPQYADVERIAVVGLKVTLR